MATETHIPESVYLKEIGDNVLTSQILEEKVTELLVGNKVKQVESSNQVAETVNTQVEAGMPTNETNESGTFFQALSVPMVTSSTPESFDAATTKDQDPEFVKTSESVEDHTEEITPTVEIKEKTANQGTLDDIATDVCVSTQTEAKGETIESEEKNAEKAVEKEACEEKDESAVGYAILSDSMEPSKQEALNKLEKNQDEGYGATSSHDETSEDIKQKTPGSYASPVADIKEQDLNEFVKKETEGKSADAPQAIEQRESVNKIDQEEETEEIMPSVEIAEKMDASTTDASISTQSKSQVENTEHEEKPDIPSIKNASEEKSSEKVDYESSGIKLNEKAIAIVNKDEDEVGEKEVSVVEKDQGEDVITSAHDVSLEGTECEVLTSKDSTEEDTKEIRSSVETTDVCISTQTKPEEETTKEKNEETIESEDGPTTKSGIHLVKEICEDTVSEKTKSEEGLKPSDSSSKTLNETEIVSKDEDHEKEQTESEVKTTKLEQVNAGVTVSEDGQKENSDNLSIKEVCEETDSEKVESELVELSDSSNIKLNEKEITNLSNDQVQEKEQDQGEEVVTLHDGIDTDICVSTEAELKKETIENEDMNDDKAIEKEVCEETSPEKAESEVGLQLSDRMEPIENEDLNIVEKAKGDGDGITSSPDTTCEDTKETTPSPYAATVADFKEQDLNEFVKEETEDKSTDAQQASEECENGENDKTEQKPEESAKHENQENEQEINILEKDQDKDDFTSTQDISVEGALQEKNYHIEDIEGEIVKETESIEEDTQEIKFSAETTVQPEQQRLLNAIPTDVCISAQTEPDKTTESEEMNDNEAIASDVGQTEKYGTPMVEEISEETALEKAESEEGLKLSNSTSMALNENEIVSKDEGQEKVQELYVSEKDQNGGNDVTSSQNASGQGVKETTGHVSTVVDLEEVGNKSIDIQEASEQYEDTENENTQQNTQDSVKDIVHSSSKIEHEECTEEMTPSVETNEEKNVCISTQTESQEESTNNEERAFVGDDDLKEKSDNPFVKGVCEETDVKKTESQEEIGISDISKIDLNEKAEEIKDQEKEQEPKTLVLEDELGKNYDVERNEHEIVQTGESIKGDTEDIRTSVEREEITEQQESLHAITSDVSILEQKESQEDTNLNEEKNDEPIKRDDVQKEKPDMLSVKEDCEETSLEKVESEEQLDLHDSPNMTINYKSITFKDEDQEQDQMVTSQDKVNVTNSEDATSKEEVLQEKNHHSEGNEPEYLKSREIEDEDSKEIKSSVETKENSEQEELSHVITTDVFSSTQTKPIEETVETDEKNDDDETKKRESSLVKDVCESTISEKDNSEEGVKHYDSVSTTLIENETENKEKKLEKEHELKISEVQGGEDDVISSQNASNEDVKEITISERATPVAYFEEGQDVSEMSEEIVKSTDAQEASKQCDNEANDNREQLTEESVNKPVNSCLESVEGSIIEEEAYADKKKIEAKIDAENQADITEETSRIKDEIISEMSTELEQPKEQNFEEIEACLTKTVDEKREDDIRKEDLSHDSIEDTNDSTSKREKDTLEHEPTEEQKGSFGELSKEKLTDLLETKAVEPQEDITLSGTLGTSTEDTSKSEKVKVESEVLPIEDLESVSEIQIPEEVPKLEELNVKEECVMSVTAMHVDEETGIVTDKNSNEEKTEQTTQMKQETFEEVCEETSSEKAESEALKLSDSSSIKINEKVMTDLYDEDQEKGQDVNISTEGQSKDNATSSNDTKFEKEELQEKNCENEFDETREIIDEDTKEIKSSGETKENKSEIPLFTEVTEATSSDKAEPEDGVKHSESFNMKVAEDEKVSKEENLENKEELTVSEVQGSEEDVINSDNVSNEDIKETTIGQCATTVVDFEEGQDPSATTKEILVEEAAEDKTEDAQEVNEPYDNEAKNKSEQNPEESVDQPVKSCVEIVEGNITEDDTNAENNNEMEAKLEEENLAERTYNRSEVKDEVVSTEKTPSESAQPKEQNIEEIEACLTETVTEKTEDEITKREEDSSHESIEDPNDNTTAEEKQPLEHEPAEERHGGLDDVSKENLTSLYETNAVEPQQDITTSKSLETSTEDSSNSERVKAESENLPIEDPESVSEVQVPQVVPNSADIKAKEECFISEATTKETSSDEIADKSYITTEENVSQTEQIGDNDSPYEKIDMEEAGTQENQHNSAEECDEMVKDVILTEKISNREVTEVRVDTQIGQEDLLDAEVNSCKSNVNNESVDETPKEEKIPALEEVKTREPEVNLSNIEATAYPSESESLPTPALESVCDVQTSEIRADTENLEVKEECIVLETVQHTDENRVEEEQKKITNEILSVPEEENIEQVPDKSNEEKTDLNIKENSSTEESLALHGEFQPASESIIEEDKVKKIEPQSEQSDITPENIMNDQESKLEHMTEKVLEDGKRDMEEDLIGSPENRIKSIENQNEIMKNVIVTDEVSGTHNFPTELDTTSTLSEKELTNEVELSKLIQGGNTEVTTEAKTESKIEVENLQPAEDLSYVPKESSTIIGEAKDNSVDETSKNEVIPVPEIESTDTPLNEQDSVKLKGIPCSSQEILDEKVVLVSQLTDREILSAPDVEFEKKERGGELISDVQTPEAILKMEMKEEQPKATNDTCETLLGVESSEKKLESTVPPKELTSSMAEDQTNELVPETDKIKVEHSSVSNTDQNPKSMEQEFTETFSEDQTSLKERYIEEEKQGNFGVENKEEKTENELAEDVVKSEVPVEDETAKESTSIKENINEENEHNQLTSATDEVCENERSSFGIDKLLEKKESVEDTEDPKSLTENLSLKEESFSVIKESKEVSHLVTPEFESLENMVTEEKIIKTDANEEKETQHEPQAYDPAQTTSDLTESPNEASDNVEIVSEGRVASTVLTENLQHALEKHNPISTVTEKIEDKEIECVSVEKTGELQVSTLNSEIVEGKENVPGDNDNIIEDSLVLPSVEKDTKQGVDTRFEEDPATDISKHEKGLNHTIEVKSVDVASNAECLETEPTHLDTKEATLGLINQENKKEADENTETLIPLEDVKTEVRSADLEVPSVMVPNKKKIETYEAEKGVINDDEHLESTGDRSRPVEEASGIKQELDAPVSFGTGATDELELDAPVSFGTGATDELNISPKDLTDDLTKISAIQPDGTSGAYTVDKHSPNEATAKSLISEVEDLNVIKSSSTEPKCSSEVPKQDEEMSNEKHVSPEATKVDSPVCDQNIIGEREVVLTKDVKADKEETGDEENEDEEEEDNEKTGDAPVMVEASKDMEVKVHKKSHNILSGVGSKVKHSIAKVKKAITGKSSHPKPASP